MAFQPNLVIKAVLRDCSEDLMISEMCVGAVATHFVSIDHFTEEESARCHENQSFEDNMKAFLEILSTKNDESLDVLIEYLDKKTQTQPHLVRLLSAARERRRIKPEDDDEEEESELAPGDFMLALGGVEIIRNIVMASPTAKGKWLDIAMYIIQSPYHITKLKAVNAGRPEKMIDMSLEFWITGTETDHRPTFDTLIDILETRKMKKLAEEVLKKKEKIQEACENPATGELPSAQE